MTLALIVIGVWALAMLSRGADAQREAPDQRWAKFRGIGRLRPGALPKPEEFHCRWAPEDK